MRARSPYLRGSTGVDQTVHVRGYLTDICSERQMGIPVEYRNGSKVEVGLKNVIYY